MKHTTLIIIMMLTACCTDPQRLRIKNRDVVADIISRAEYDTQQTTVKIIDCGTALNLLAEVK